MDHQFIVSGIGLPFNVKPQLFPQREHVPVLMQHDAVHRFKTLLFGNGQAFFQQVAPNALALPGITHQNGEFTRPAIRIADDSGNPQHVVGFRFLIDGHQRDLPVVIDLGEAGQHFGIQLF
jgi:hypothetical protein